jgi:hypothetical protein
LPSDPPVCPAPPRLPFTDWKVVLRSPDAEHDASAIKQVGCRTGGFRLCKLLPLRLVQGVKPEGEDPAVAQYKLATFYYVNVGGRP